MGMDPKVMEIDPLHDSLKPLRDLLAGAAVNRGAAPQQPDAPFANAPNVYSQLYEGDLAQSYMQPVQQPPSSFANIIMGLLGQQQQAPNPNAGGTPAGYRPPQGFNTGPLGGSDNGGGNGSGTGRQRTLGIVEHGLTQLEVGNEYLTSGPLSAVDEMLNRGAVMDITKLPDVPPDLMGIMGINPAGMSKEQFYSVFIPKVMQHRQQSQQAAMDAMANNPRFQQLNQRPMDPNQGIQSQLYMPPAPEMPAITSGSRMMNAMGPEINPPGMTREKKVV